VNNDAARRHLRELKKILAANTTTNRAITTRISRVTVIGGSSSICLLYAHGYSVSHLPHM